MARYGLYLVPLSLVLGLIGCTVAPTPKGSPPIQAAGSPQIHLPEPKQKGDISVEEALSRRRSIRDYADGPLTLAEVSQLLWAAQGITSDRAGRTAPSAGALYPLEVYLAVGQVEGLAPGVYHYSPQTQELTRIQDGDTRAALAQAALNQTWVGAGAVDLVIAASYERTTRKYGERGVRYVHMEAGHAAQNIYLQAAALGLGTVAVGAFDDERVQAILGLPAGEAVLYLMPVGRTNR